MGGSIIVSKSYFFLSTQFFTKKNEKTVKRDLFIVYAAATFWFEIHTFTTFTRNYLDRAKIKTPSQTKFRVNRANILNGFL